MKIIENDMLGSVIIGSVFLIIIIAAEIWARKGNPSNEAIRKFIHINGGIASLLFPFFITSPYFVFGLAFAFSSLFYLSAKLGFLKSLNSVERESRGSEYYPFAIWLLFTISVGKLWLYISSVLVLALADAGAALIGNKYGAIHYKIGDSKKSLEGSIFFWIIAFIAIQIPMLLLSDLSRETCILTALLVSFLLTCVEAVSVKGTDNIFVPVIACYVLLKITTKPVDEIMFQCISLFAIFAIFGSIIWKTKLLNTGAALIFLGMTYASWSLGSIHWALPAFSAFILFTIVRFILNKKKRQPVIKARILFAALVIPFSILIFANMLDLYKEYFSLYVTSYVMIASFSVWRTVLRSYEINGFPKLMAGPILSAVIAWCFVCVPVWMIQGIPFLSPLGILALSVLFSIIHEFVSRKLHISLQPTWSHARFILILLAIAACWFIQHLGIVGLWNPI